MIRPPTRPGDTSPAMVDGSDQSRGDRRGAGRPGDGKGGPMGRKKAGPQPAAGSNPRRPLSPEHRAKIGAASRGRTHSPETRAKMSAAHKGHEVSPETRARMSAAKKGRRRGIPGSAAEGGGT